MDIKNFSRQEWGMHLLRLGLSAVFLWFGFSQLIDSTSWASIVPEWASNLLNVSPVTIVLTNGFFEVVLGTLLALGFFVRIIAFIFAIHLIPIAMQFGFDATAIRDYGLAVASFALSLLSEVKYNKRNLKML